MAIEQPDFSKIFADGATIGELLNMPDEEYLRGWGYLGQNEPPPMEYFNYVYNLQDNKLKYLFISANIRKSNTQYHVDDIVTSPNLQSKFMLVCIQEGTTDSNEPVLDAAEEGQEITDGTAKWRVFSKLASGITVGEEEPVNARDNAVWLALNGVDDIAQLKYQKDGEWKQVYTDSILNAVKDCPIKSLLRNTKYNVSDIVADSTCKGAFLVCTGSGTTGASVASGLATASEGQEITDGTAKFKVHYFKEIISSVNIMSGATSSKGGTAGLVPAPKAGDQNKALFGNGQYQEVIVKTDIMVGATSSNAGIVGLVPVPAAGKQTSFLRGDGTWQTVPQPVIATQAEAEAGTDNTKHMTPLRVKQAINKLVPPADDYIVDYYVSGRNWWRKWKSGWLEQGGYMTATGRLTEVTLLKPMANTNYTAHVNDVGQAYRSFAASAKSTTVLNVWCQESGMFGAWSVRGMGA